MQLLIKELPSIGDGKVVLRHWLVYPDSRIFFQDETLSCEGPGEPRESMRTDWVQLPTPPIVAEVRGVVEYKGLPVAICSDGKAYIWTVREPRNAEEEMRLQALVISHRTHEWPHTWRQFNEPVPGTPAYADYNK